MLQILRDVITSHFAPALKIEPAALDNLLEAPKVAGRGQLALPVFAMAKVAKRPPPQLAAELTEALNKIRPAEIAAIEPQGGFINFTFRDDYVQNTLAREVLGRPENVGHSALGLNQKMLIDFSSPNVAKPMHVGHLRASVIGQALVNLAKTQGYDVIALNHLGDWGVQFGKLAWAYREWGHEYPFEEKPFESLFDLYVRFHREAEAKPELGAEGSKVFKALEDGDLEIKKLWQKFVEISLADYARLWEKLGIKHDLIRGESFYNDRLKAVEDELAAKHLLVESDGAQIVKLDEDNIPPCLIRKSDGASLYATRDLASALYRMVELKADLNLYVVGVDQTLHFRQVFAVLKKMGYTWVDRCHHIAFGMYRFKDAQISTRKGNAIFLEDVLDKAVELVREIIAAKNPDLPDKEKVAEQVGIGAIVFNDLVNDRVKNVDFDWGRALDFEGDSGPYVQYCGVRCRSLARKFGKPAPSEFAVVLGHPEEKELMRALLNYQDVLSGAFDHFKPHILAGYLIEICRKFNQFYNKCRILGEPAEIESARMTLVRVTEAVIASGLNTLGIALPEAM